VGLIGCGNIGSFIARHLEKAKHMQLASIYDVDKAQALKLASRLKKKPKISKNIPSLLQQVDFVVEAASQEVVRKNALQIVKAGKDLMIMSVGAFSDARLYDRITNEAGRHGVTVYLPSGAVCGVDGIKAACVGEVAGVLLTTTKPPKALRGVPYLQQKGIDVDKIRKPLVVFSGSAADAARLFPKNINVSTVLSLAGIGSEKTKVRVIADPAATRNVHEVHVVGECGEISITLLNKPSPSNPKTSLMACFSAARTLDDVGCGVRLGT